jgi:hypothetical protein
MYDESEQYTQRQFKRRKKVYYKTENAVRYKVYQRRRKGIVIQRYQVKFRSIGTVPKPTKLLSSFHPRRKSPHSKKEEYNVVA